MSKLLFVLKALILPQKRASQKDVSELSCVPEGSCRHE
jgi:hypothetical protein